MPECLPSCSLDGAFPPCQGSPAWLNAICDSSHSTLLEKEERCSFTEKVNAGMVSGDLAQNKIRVHHRGKLRCLTLCGQHCHTGHTEWQLGVHGGGLLTCLPCGLPAVDLHWGATQALPSTLQGSSLTLTAIMKSPLRPPCPLQACCQA